VQIVIQVGKTNGVELRVFGTGLEIAIRQGVPERNRTIDWLPRCALVGEEVRRMLRLELWLVIHVRKDLQRRDGRLCPAESGQREHCDHSQGK
jgi:hypothetical protein